MGPYQMRVQAEHAARELDRFKNVTWWVEPVSRLTDVVKRLSEDDA